ncbi:PAS domain S-box protein [Aerosakkonema sp. BLCC-F183]|uniref:PAS domain S-box protein n=1 Tax=Aerosakkonema sp. BLCC-F183 TaxID=3342834 RepID=UPI0035BAD47B
MMTTELVALQTAYTSLESALKKSQALLDATFEQTIIGLAYCDLQGKFVRVNRKFGEVVGSEISELINRTFSEITHPENPQIASVLSQQLIQGELANYEWEICFPHPDGTVACGQLTLSLVREESGEPVFLFLTIADITQHKNLAEQLQQKETPLSEQLKICQFALEHAADAIFWVKADAQFCYVNLAACRLSGYDREELFAMKVFQIDPNFTPAIWKQEWENLKQQGFLQFDSHIQAKDGRFIPVQISVNYLEFEGCEYNCAFMRDISDRISAETALRKSEQQYETLTRLAPVGIFRTDAAGKVIYANERCIEMVGLRREMLLGDGWVQTIHPEDIEEVLTKWLKTIKQHSSFQCEHRIVRPDGSIVWVLTQAIAEFETDGTIIGYVGTLTDISERKRVEAELTQAQKFLASVLENLPVSVVAKEATELRFVLWNPATTNILGYTPEEVLGKNDYDFFPKEQADFFTSKDREALNAGKFIEIPEEPIQIKTGETRFFHTRKTGITDNEGNPQYLLAIAEDITERKLALEALAENEERWRQIFTEAPIGIALANTDNHRIEKVNRALCEMLGYTEAELLTMTPADITHPEDRKLEISLMKQVVSGKIPRYQIEKRLLTKNYDIIWVNMKATILRHPDGTIRYGLAMIENITQRKNLERELALRQARFDAFFSTAPAALVMLDDRLRYVQINDAAAEMNGLSVKEYLGKTFGEVVPELADSLAPIFEKILTTGEPMLNMEVSGEAPKETGTIRHWIASFFPLPGEDCRPVGLGIVAVEITALKRAETALQESLERFELVLKATNDGIWEVRYTWLDEHTPKEQIYYSPRLMEFVGFTKSELKNVSQSYINRIHPEDRVRVDRALSAHINEAVPYQDIEYRIRNSTGEYRWVIARGQALWDTAGRVTRFAGSMRDITDRKRAETALKEKVAREKLLNQLVSQIRTSFDLDKILVTVVSSLQNLLNVDSCAFSWYRAYSSNLPASREEDGEVWEIVHEAKKPHIASLIGIYPTQAYGSITQRLIEGKIIRVNEVTTCGDPELQQACMSFGYTSAIAIPIMTNSGEIGTIGCYHSTGVRPWTDAELEFLQAVCNQLAIAISQAELYNQATQTALVAQEKARLLEATLSELKSAQLQLIQSEKMSSLGQMVAGIAHEINNPVSFIYGNIDHASRYISDLLSLVELYAQHYPQPADAITDFEEDIDLDFLKLDLPKLLGSMKIGATRIQEIVRSLRTFSRLDEAEKKAIDLHEGLDSTLRLLEHRLSEKSGHPAIQVIKNYGNLPLAECYAGQLNQVFMNLLTNAIDAIEETYQGRSYESIKANPGKITITTELKNSSRVIIKISDNGAGIPESVKKRLFDPFFTTKPVGKGTGLGLSISYQIVVERHSGELRCVSSPGKGTEFAIEIPL